MVDSRCERTKLPSHPGMVARGGRMYGEGRAAVVPDEMSLLRQPRFGDWQVATRSTADHPGGLRDLISVTECMWMSVCMCPWQVMLVGTGHWGVWAILYPVGFCCYEKGTAYHRLPAEGAASSRGSVTLRGCSFSWTSSLPDTWAKPW